MKVGNVVALLVQPSLGRRVVEQFESRRLEALLQGFPPPSRLAQFGGAAVVRCETQSGAHGQVKHNGRCEYCGRPLVGDL
jgi:hypothetical protein